MAAIMPNHVQIQKADNFSAAPRDLKKALVYRISYGYEKHVLADGVRLELDWQNELAS